MTERGRACLSRTRDRLSIGASSMDLQAGRLVIRFDEMALPWPGQRFLPRRISGTIEITAAIEGRDFYSLDAAGRHVWSPRMPKAKAVIRSQALADGGWSGEAYHDMNFGARPLEQDFLGWDWARGSDEETGETVVLYDALPRDGARHRLGLRFGTPEGTVEFEVQERHRLRKGFWGVGGGIACEDGGSPVLLRRLEDSPFYTRSLVKTRLDGRDLTMVHETLDCVRLANPLVRLMLPFRMPRHTGRHASP